MLSGLHFQQMYDVSIAMGIKYQSTKHSDVKRGGNYQDSDQHDPP
jgi:hypothetical protein